MATHSIRTLAKAPIEASRVEIGEPSAHGTGVGGDDVERTAAQELLEVGEIGSVAAERVGRGVPFHREMPEERGHRLLHVTASSSSCV